jgi:two-component system sensor kinase FixL
VLDCVPLVVWTVRADGRITSINAAGLRYTGLTAEQAGALAWWDLLEPEAARDGEVSWRSPGRSEDQAVTLEGRVKCAGGLLRLNKVSIEPLKDEGGACWVGSALDIEDQRRAEDRLVAARKLREESSDLLNMLLAASPVGVAFLDTAFRYLRANESFLEISGLRRDGFVGRSVEEVQPEAWKVIGPAMMRALQHGERTQNLEVSGTTPTHRDEIRHRLVSCFPLKLMGQVAGIGMMKTDITEPRRAETRLQELQSELLHVSRLSAMGELGSALAHEVNQPLTAIGNYMRAAVMMLESDQPGAQAKIRTALDRAGEQAVRASDIIRNLREFTRKGQSVLKAEKLDGLIDEAISLTTLGAAGRRAKIRARVAASAHYVKINRIQIEQVLVNLLRNAIEASDGAMSQLINLRAAPEGEFVRISVSDTGAGLDPTILETLFKPFVTSKPDGVGLGLAISRSIIEAHGGVIGARPNPKGGATFWFTVPKASETDYAAQAAEQPERPGP